MQESGAFLLRAMQNEDMPRLDLLVRESVQNALDAALDRRPGGEVRVGFHVRDHTAETIASLLDEGIDRKVLLARYPAGGQMLEIRDSMTEGLTGPLGFEEIGPDGAHGNLLKLVYEIGRTRSDAGAGGSWGLGKTCYFRMGAGLVFYYSRISLGDGYQERLVASLVEDETSPDRLQRGTRTGIGWWGAEGGLKPITRTSQIHRALDRLRVQPFTGTETGTSVIIPFLRDDLAPPADGNGEDSQAPRPWWYGSQEAYIRIALERWFCARLDNVRFATGPRLIASVNGKVITSETMLPVFRAAQALYNRAIGAPVGEGDYLTRAGVAADAIIGHAVAPRNLFTPHGPAGDVAAALFTPEQLGMGAPDNHHDPGTCVFGRPDAVPPYRPLVTFMRRPGMCVCWDDSTESRGWAGGLPGLADGRYLVAVFVPRQERVLANDRRRTRDEGPISLESYLRGCERADHAAWHDVAGLKIVEKLRLNCGRFLREFGTRRPAATDVAPSIRLARNLADLVLPARGMGADGRTGCPSPPRRPGQGGNGEGGRRRPVPATPALDLLEVTYAPQEMQIRWSLDWGAAPHSLPRKISLGVDSESGSISLQQWRDDGLGPFPFRVLGAEIDPGGDNGRSARVRIASNDDGEILLHAVGNGPVDAVAGVLRIRLATGKAVTLRPVLVAGLVETNAGDA
jgi:hypothetical protein